MLLSHERKGVAFNLLFLGYIAVVQPLLVPILLGVIHEGQVNIILGVAILLAIIIETVGIYYKSGALGQRVTNTDRFGVGFFFIWVMHAVVTVIMYMWALSAFGVDVAADQPHWSMSIIFLVVIKELFVMGFIFLIGERKKKVSPQKEWLADFLLLFFVCVAYTATWESMVAGPNSDLSQYSTREAMVQACAAALIFIMFYIPVRMMQVIEDWYSIRTVRGAIEWIVSMVLLTVTVIASLL